MNEKELRDDIAGLLHTAWAQWTETMLRVLYPQLFLGSQGEYPNADVKHWMHGIATPYAFLPEDEKAAYSDWARRLMGILHEHGLIGELGKYAERYAEAVRQGGPRVHIHHLGEFPEILDPGTAAAARRMAEIPWTGTEKPAFRCPKCGNLRECEECFPSLLPKTPPWEANVHAISPADADAAAEWAVDAAIAAQHEEEE